MEKKRAILTSVVFLLLIFGFALYHLLLPDQEASTSERRKLTQAPSFNAERVFSGAFAEELESYLLDQFPLRQQFLSANKTLRYYALGQRGLDGIYVQDDSAFEAEPLEELQVRYAADKILAVAESFPETVQVYYAVIPDKGAFAEDQGQPKMDYDRLRLILSDRLSGSLTEISIWDQLSFADYYGSDLHWKQECIYPVARTLANAMGAQLPALEEFTANELKPFYGSYYSRSGKPLPADTLTYLSSPYTAGARVTSTDFAGVRPVYMPQLLSGMDGYDVFLSGAQSILTIEIPNAQSNRELVIFRDSFGSSIAPYFMGAYSKITLIDLRYVSSSVLQNYVTFTDQDVLFLYSTGILNNGSALK